MPIDAEMKTVQRYKFRPPDKRRPVVILTRDSVLDCLGEVTDIDRLGRERVMVTIAV